MFDVSTLALKDTTTLQLRHPVTGELLFADEVKKKPVEIELFGTSSKQYRNAIAGIQSRALKRSAKKEQATPEAVRKESTELLVTCSASAKNLSYGGVPVTDESHFRDLYSDPKLSWIRDQVDEALADVSNFLAQ